MVDAVKSRSTAGHYDASYANFESDLYAAIRREAFGEDLGQNSWLTADELLRFVPHLALSKEKKLLGVACGAGGPALKIAGIVGCSVVGIDVHDKAIEAAQSLAAKSPATRSEFRLVNASEKLPFPKVTFDAITCIDAINHLPDRPAVISDWVRVLKPGGRLLFTDPITITGPISKEELAIRSSLGFFLFVPGDYDRKILADCGLRLILCDDVTENTFQIAQKRRLARSSREEALRKIEGDASFEQQQHFLEVASRLAQEHRLSRFLYVAEKPF
ncbi:MAG TPA: methyltransferase domain-containing protein [Candidatus Sulfotelmatobacter sp.]|nr:methyltransferase domain-containing protein [Candidatus Sulfotelmatobacter sp.]